MHLKRGFTRFRLYHWKLDIEHRQAVELDIEQGFHLNLIEFELKKEVHLNRVRLKGG